MSEPKMVDKKPCWTTSKEEADKLVDELSEVCFEYGKDESNPKMLNVFYATKALKNYVGIMQGRIELLTARIAELEEKQRWRVVANGELPEDGEVVWLWDGKYIGMGYYLVFAGQFMDRDTPLRRIKPTHWMPLPESPNDTQTQTIVYRKESEE